MLCGAAGTDLFPTLFSCSFVLTLAATPLASAFLSRPGVHRSDVPSHICTCPDIPKTLVLALCAYLQLQWAHVVTSMHAACDIRAGHASCDIQGYTEKVLIMFLMILMLYRSHAVRQLFSLFATSLLGASDCTASTICSCCCCCTLTVCTLFTQSSVTHMVFNVKCQQSYVYHIFVLAAICAYDWFLYLVSHEI